VQWINVALAAQKKVVVLATGDPLCHGIANNNKALLYQMGLDDKAITCLVSHKKGANLSLTLCKLVDRNSYISES
jgi:siroheme synthase